MKQERWLQIEAVLDELLDLPPEQRPERLEKLAAADPGLRSEVEPFLAEDTDGPLDRPLEAFAAAILPEATQEQTSPGVEDLKSEVGRQIGPYRVLSEIGHGGMGRVLLAERTDGEFEDRVALKLVRGGRPDIVERFRHERQILARLRHSHIATLFDGGATEDGEPYFAMEFVDGEPITKYCDRLQLDLDHRIALFQDVCHAVQYAHRNLVIHRDLKPSNVLVTKDGTVKLLDFGIAKIVDAEQGGGVQTTRQFLTPAYAAPEQILGEPTSTATDIYSLGVLLYELLTGRNPHGDTTRSAKVARAVVEADPPSASAAIDEDRGTACGGTPETIRRGLRGDLDNILQKALRKAPEERYSSAEDLRADLERHRKQLPISARPATLAYRLSRFAQRNRVGALSLATGILAVIAGVAGVAWQANVAARERDHAREETARAEAVKDFLLDVFSAADPSAESGAALTAVELAQRGAEQIEDGFADDPEVRAEVLSMLGTVFLRLGEYERADTLLSRANEAHRALGDDRGVVSTLVDLGDTYQWQERYEEARSCLEEAIALGEANLSPDDPVVSSARMSLGIVFFRQGKYGPAEETLRLGLANVRRIEGENSRLVVDHLTDLADVLRGKGDLTGAAEMTQTALDIERRLNPEGGVSTARLLSGLADMIDDLDRPEEALALSREAVEVFRREYGEQGHPELAIAISNLAGTVRDLGNLDEALDLGREVIEVFSRSLGPDHAFVARAHNNLSVTLNRAGDRRGAAEASAESVRLGKISFGPRHPAIVPFLGNYASIRTDMGEYAAAESIYAEALSISEEAQTNEFGRTYSQLGMASIYRKTGRLEQAEELMRKAWAIRKEIVGEGHSAELHTRIELASLLNETGRPDDARALLDSAIEESREGLPATRRTLDKALAERAILARDSGESADLHASVLRELIQLRRETLSDDDPKITRLEDALVGLTGL